MYTKELAAFITVADKGSFLKAAQALYTTPASVMNRINKFESDVGVKLVERTNRGARLTAAGRTVYRYAKQITELADEAVKKTRESAEAEKNVIRIGTSIMRPCKRLIELWSKIDADTLPYRLRVVPFDDEPAAFRNVLGSLGKDIDCFVGPCDSADWQKRHSILVIDKLPCRVAVPRKHRLANKKRLRWQDLHGEIFMLVERGNSPVLDRLRDDILENRPQIKIADSPDFYDTSVFNECEQMNYLMETLDIWADVHPSLITLPMEWDYEIAYGIIYAKQPSKAVEEFIDVIGQI